MVLATSDNKLIQTTTLSGDQVIQSTHPSVDQPIAHASRSIDPVEVTTTKCKSDEMMVLDFDGSNLTFKGHLIPIYMPSYLARNLTPMGTLSCVQYPKPLQYDQQSS